MQQKYKLVGLLLIAAVGFASFNVIYKHKAEIDDVQPVSEQIESEGTTRSTSTDPKQNQVPVRNPINKVVDVPTKTVDTVSPLSAKQTTATLQVLGTTHKITLAENSTVADLMNKAKSENLITFETKEYPSLGLFVLSINGVKSNDTPGYNWTYYINGERAPVGISNYIVKENDVISWTYEK